MTNSKIGPDEQSAQSKATLLIRVFIAILLLAAAVTAILQIEPSSEPVPAAIGGRRPKTSPAAYAASASPRNANSPTTDVEARQLIIGVWQDDYQGQRTLTVRPDGTAGYAACDAATDDAVEQGSVGAGTGATVAKALGAAGMLKGGIGSASEDLGGGLIVGAIVAVNAVGEVYDGETGRVIAGPRGRDGRFVATLDAMRRLPDATPPS